MEPCSRGRSPIDVRLGFRHRMDGGHLGVVHEPPGPWEHELGQVRGGLKIHYEDALTLLVVGLGAFELESRHSVTEKLPWASRCIQRVGDVRENDSSDETAHVRTHDRQEMTVTGRDSDRELGRRPWVRGNPQDKARPEGSSGRVSNRLPPHAIQPAPIGQRASRPKREGIQQLPSGRPAPKGPSAAGLSGTYGAVRPPPCKSNRNRGCLSEVAGPFEIGRVVQKASRAGRFPSWTSSNLGLEIREEPPPDR